MKTLFNGFLKIKEFFREGQRYEVMDRGDSVTVLLVKPGLSFEDDQFYIGIQYRAGSNSYQDTQVAGMLDPLPGGVGYESPKEAALREAMEEAGASGKIVPMYNGYPSPGGCTERTHQFVMMVDSLSPPTDLTENIKWNWITGEELINCYGSRGPSSMQLNNSINIYRLNRDKYIKEPNKTNR